MDANGINQQSHRSRSSTRLPAAGPGGQLRSGARSSSRQTLSDRQAFSRLAPSTDSRPDPVNRADRASKLHSGVRTPSPGTRGCLQHMLQPHKPHLHKQPLPGRDSRIPVRTPTPPFPGSSSMPAPASKPTHTQLPRTHSHQHPATQHSPARPPAPPLLPRMFSPSDPYLQGSKGLHERGLAALKEYRRLRAERIQQALRARQQQQIPQTANGHLRYTIQQPPFLAGRPRSSSIPPNTSQVTPTRSGSRGRSGQSQSPLSATQTPFSADRPRVSRRGSSVCADRRGSTPAKQRSGSITTPPSTPPDRHSAVSTTSSPSLLVAGGPVLKVTPKLTPKLRARANRTDSHIHAETLILQPQSPPSMRLQEQHTDTTLTNSSAPTEGSLGGGMEDLLLQQVTALLAEKSSWTSEKQRLEKEVEQLHELIEYLFEQFNVPMDDGSVPLDNLTGLPQYLPGSDSNLPSNSSAQFTASAELPPSFGGSFGDNPGAFQTQSAQLPHMHSNGQNSMMGASNGNVMHYNSADLPPVPRGERSNGNCSASANGMLPQQKHSSGAARSPGVMQEECDATLAPIGGPVAEADASFISMIRDGMTMMSGSDAPHAGCLVAESSASPKAFPLVVDGPR